MPVIRRGTCHRYREQFLCERTQSTGRQHRPLTCELPGVLGCELQNRPTALGTGLPSASGIQF